jgi:hypothetical protein
LVSIYSGDELYDDDVTSGPIQDERDHDVLADEPEDGGWPASFGGQPPRFLREEGELGDVPLPFRESGDQ